MEEFHRTHKEVPFGWLALLGHLVDGFPRARRRSQRPGVVTPWSTNAGAGWSA